MDSTLTKHKINASVMIRVYKILLTPSPKISDRYFNEAGGQSRSRIGFE